MKKMMITVILTLALAASVAGVGLAAEPTQGLMDRPGPLHTGKQQTACPVQGGKINKEVYTDYQGQRVYFCCPACIDIFKKDPEKFLRKMQEKG
jgi:YHS domain-containing protein